MIINTYIASPALAEFVDCYWELLIPDDYNQAIQEFVPPSGNHQMIFHFGKVMKESSKNGEKDQYKAMLCGQKLSASDVQAMPGTHFFAIVFKPYGARPFLHFPMHESFGLDLKIEDILKSDEKYIIDALNTAKIAQERINIIEQFLLKRMLIKKPHKFEEIKHASQLIDTHSGKLKISKVADHMALSPRTLERLFKSELGLSAKNYSRIRKMMSVIENEKLHSKSLTEIAYEAGYYDQAHFIKDIKDLTGRTPKELLKMKDK